MITRIVTQNRSENSFACGHILPAVDVGSKFVDRLIAALASVDVIRMEEINPFEKSKRLETYKMLSGIEIFDILLSVLTLGVRWRSVALSSPAW